MVTRTQRAAVQQDGSERGLEETCIGRLEKLNVIEEIKRAENTSEPW